MIPKKLLSILVASTFILSAAPSFANEVAEVAVDQKSSSEYSSDSGSGSESIESLPDEKNAKISKDEAQKISLEILKKCYNIDFSEKETVTSIQLRQDYMPNADYVWEMSFNKYIDQTSTNINMSINAQTGDLIRLDNYSNRYYPDESILALITEERAKQIAEDFIKKIDPEIFDKLEYVDIDKSYLKYRGSGSANYQFLYIQKVKGIPVSSNTISIEVNGRSSSLASYYCNWDNNDELPSAEGAISKEEALKALKSASSLKLQYIPVRSMDNYREKVDSTTLVYAQEPTSSGLINALDGKLLEYTNAAKQESKELSKDQKDQLLKTIAPMEKCCD
jgi:hypothetical protein